MGPCPRQEAVFVHLLGLTWLIPGKWVYEVLISSQGLMQIGWCTINCRFNQEVRAGEAPSQGELLLPRASPGRRQPTHRARSALDCNPGCLLEEECVPPHPRATQPRQSLLVSEHRPLSLELCGSKVDGLWAVALLLTYSLDLMDASSLGGGWRYTQLLCL